MAPGGDLSVWLHGVEDPATSARSSAPRHALADGPVTRAALRRPVLAEGRAGHDGVAVRAAAGAGALGEPLPHAGSQPAAKLRYGRPRSTCRWCSAWASESGLPAELERDAVRIEVRAESLNVAVAASIGLYEAANRMAGHG